jgi:hypothetical protein
MGYPELSFIAPKCPARFLLKRPLEIVLILELVLDRNGDGRARIREVKSVAVCLTVGVLSCLKEPYQTQTTNLLLADLPRIRGARIH